VPMSQPLAHALDSELFSGAEHPGGNYDIKYGTPLSCLMDSTPTGEGGNLTEHIMRRRELLPWNGTAPAKCDYAKAAAETKAAADLLRAEIQHLSSRSDCSNADDLLEVEPLDTGWLALLHSGLGALMRGLMDKRTVMTPSSRTFVGKATCPQRDFICFFEKWAPTCDAHYHPEGAGATDVEYDMNVRAVEPKTYDPSNKEIERMQYPNWVNTQKANGKKVLTPDGYDATVPSQYASLGYFGVSSIAFGWMTSPNADMLADIHTRLSTTGLGTALAGTTPVIGMHVRQGDSCGDGWRTGRKCSELSEYMEIAEEVRSKTGASTIYLATDSESIINKTAEYPSWTFLRMKEATEWQKELKVKTADAWAFNDPTHTHKSQMFDDVMRYNYFSNHTDWNRRSAWETTIDTQLLSYTDIFIGKFSSNFFRSAFELHSSRCNCAPPFVSMDAAWCFDWGMDAGVSKDGEKTFIC